ncbi:hypothetical protein NX790_21030 [Enterobacter asburiae]|uniref:hypothetical protein n=1 Tax=Enterobacteriaceae TaxID=543 RepID=UPI0018A9B2BE|nr:MULTISPECIES: hypothetical protein [Enterobacteriaceae]EHE3815453.1 hypothetical protein [Shigella sonnei]MCU2724199.1 hypothetical protein [Enterobacter hormaechei subsp. xiangfangensis]HAS1070053.1 hypothetical protein [Enterobacter cloacae]EJA1620112.1 hypothetical protein [Escherichia coli]MBF9065614.1 hypothetical protein [Escherichia coli]
MNIEIYYSEAHDRIYAAEKGTKQETDVTEQVVRAVMGKIGGVGYKIPVQSQGKIVAEIGMFLPELPEC